jgi:transposase
MGKRLLQLLRLDQQRQQCGVGIGQELVNDPEPVHHRFSLWKVSGNENLTTEDQHFLDRLLSINPVFRKARNVGQEFVKMVCNQRIEDWTGWLSEAISKEMPSEIRHFASGLQQNEMAVKEALKCEWSNGQVEGQVNRLKTFNHQMYGLGRFELLRLWDLLKLPS